MDDWLIRFTEPLKVTGRFQSCPVDFSFDVFSVFKIAESVFLPNPSEHISIDFRRFWGWSPTSSETTPLSRSSGVFAGLSPFSLGSIQLAGQLMVLLSTLLGQEINLINSHSEDFSSTLW